MISEKYRGLSWVFQHFETSSCRLAFKMLKAKLAASLLRRSVCGTTPVSVSRLPYFPQCDNGNVGLLSDI